MSSSPTTPPPEEVKAGTKVSFTGLFRFATSWDLTLTVLGCLAAAGQGVIFPCFSLIFGRLLSSFNSPTLDLQSTVNTLSLYFLIISLAAFVCGFLQVALPNISSENQIRRLRVEYLKALLRLPPSWHDTRKDQGEVSSRLTTDTMLIQSGMGEKMTGGIQHTITFCAGLAVGFYTSWQLTLTILACTPLLVGVLVVLKNSISKFEGESSAAYAKSGDACTETLSLIRTVSAYGGEKREIKRYQDFLMGAEAAGIRKGFVLAVCVGCVFAFMFITYAAAMAVGSTLILASRASNPQCRFNPTLGGCFSGGDVIQCFMAVLIGAFSLGQAGPNLAAIASAQGAAGPMFEIIDEVPLIDVDSPGVPLPSSSSSSSSSPPPLPSASGKIEFRRVTFRFPSRPEQTILSDFSLVIAPGATLALVGESGSGKSTLIQLILRFYDVESGAVLVDEVDVRAWDVKKLREKMGYVSQEPLLFASSVRENIAMGVQGKEVTQVDIEAAARASSSHGFITTLPSGYDTVVGTSTSSTQLSGGQRQRLCIARSLIRDPQILLLDEATSALDTESERFVQQAIDNLLSASGGTASGLKRTAVVIAHRLSTIVNSDKIVVMSKGKVVESGNHTDLIAKPEGMYAALWALQDVGGGAASASSSASPLSVRSSSLTTSGPTSSAASSTGADAGATKSSPPSSSSSSSSSSTTTTSGKDKGPSENVWDAVKDTKALPTVSRFRVWALQSEDALIMALALVGSAGSGIVQPVFGLIYSQFIAVFFDPNDQTLREKTGEYCGAFVGIAFAVFACTALRIGGFTVLGERLTRKLRVMSYRAVLRQPISFFDAPENSVGRLNTRLAADAADVKSGTGETVGQAFQAGAAIIAAAVIALMASWRLGLVVLAVMPLQVIGAAYGNQAFVGFSLGGKKALEESGHLAVEAMAGLRTVAAFGLQGQIISAYSKSLDVPYTAGVNTALSSGCGYGFSTFMMFSVYALAFYVGGVFISQGLLDFSSLMRVFLAVTMASQAVGSAMAWGPDQAKAAAATKSIFALLDRQSPIDPLEGTSISGEEETPSLSPPSAMLPSLGGPQGCSIEFKDVTFCYPTRPGIKVLDKFNLKVKAGEAVGVVGSSGSGKSTLVALLERWYDVDEGDILLDGVSIRTIKVAQLRASLALVQQQPDLMCDSIAYNIGYSSPALALPPNTGVPLEIKAVEGEKGKKSAAMDAPTTITITTPKEYPPIDPLIVQAASSANALSFIKTFEHQFHTHVGVRGGMLSGGQRQRVAIARSILRESRVMLFDEATAALDSESERVVQESLDALVAKGGQTKVIIAHRLSTVKQCDTIVVLEKGVIAEAGTHEELWALNGVYRRLAAAQEKEAI